MASCQAASQGSSTGASSRRPATPRASRDLTVSSNGCLAPIGIGAPSTSSRTWPRSTPSLGPALNGAVTGDVAKFRDRGGKLIVFQGWADPIVPVGQTVNFYKDLMSKFGGEEKTKEFARLFMVPGMGHCGFGTGPNRFDSSAFGGAQPPALDPEHDIFTALSHWVEDGVAPDSSHRDEIRRWRCVQGNRDAAAALPVSAARLVQGRRGHQLRREFRLRRRQEVKCRT